MKIDITNQVKDEFLISLKTLISYPSVLNEGENGTPFGQAIQDVLEKTLEICRDIGFTTYLDPKGYYGYAEIGQGAELLAILCHLEFHQVMKQIGRHRHLKQLSKTAGYSDVVSKMIKALRSQLSMQ